MRPDIMEPTARAIGELVANSPGLYRWNDYTADEDLIPLRQEYDDNIQFVRASDPMARIELFLIRADDLVDLTVHPPAVLRSERRASASIEIDNLTGLTAQEYTFTKEFATGESELAAVKAGFEATSKTTFGTGATAPVKGEQSFELKVTASWENKTGRTRDSKTGGKFPLIALPGTHVRGWLEWNEEDLRRHIQGFGTFECGVRIGKRYRRKRNWRWRGALEWSSISDLIATAEGHGSVAFALAHHWRAHPPPPGLIAAVKSRPRNRYDEYAEYTGATGIKVCTETLEDLRPDEDEDDDASE